MPSDLGELLSMLDGFGTTEPPETCVTRQAVVVSACQEVVTRPDKPDRQLVSRCTRRTNLSLPLGTLRTINVH